MMLEISYALEIAGSVFATWASLIAGIGKFSADEYSLCVGYV